MLGTEIPEPTMGGWTPSDKKREFDTRVMAKIDLKQHFANLDTRCLLAPIATSMSTGASVLLVTDFFVGNITIRDEGASSCSARASEQIMRVHELSDTCSLAIYNSSAGLIKHDATKVRLETPDFQLHDGKLHVTAVEKTDGIVACATDHGHLILLKGAELRSIADEKFYFGHQKPNQLSFHRIDILGASVEGEHGSFTTLDTRRPLNRGVCGRVEVDAQCHSFIDQFGVVTASCGGILSFFDVRKMVTPVVQFLEPSGGEICSLACSENGRLLKVKVDNGSVVIWDVALESCAEKKGLTHNYKGDIVRLIKAQGPLYETAWMSSGPAALAAVDSSGLLSLVDLRNI